MRTLSIPKLTTNPLTSQPTEIMIMKKSILTAMLGLGLASFASADTIYVTGSTAFRTSFVDAVVTKMLENSGTVTALHTGSNAAGFSSATRQVISGNIDGVATTICTNWTGSVEGVQAVVQPTVRIETYLTGSGTSLTRTGTYPTFTFSGGTANPSAPAAAHAADLAMSDCFQNSTVYTTPALTTDYKVCVIPFKFVASENSNTAGASGTGFDNITPLQAQLLWGSGRVSLSLFTFNSADNKPALPTVNVGKEVFAMGRANTSGTRLVSFAEMGRGALSNTVQYSFNGTSSGGTAGAGGWTSQGNGGSGASTVASQLGLPASSSTGYGIGYLGLTDADAAIAAGARELKWNGVSYSAANVYSGKYTFWAYEHLLANNNASQAALDVAASLATQINAQPGAAGLDSSLMNVQRSAEGSLIDLND